MKNKKGFSVVELMLAIALSGMVLLAFLDVMQYMRILENKVRIKADSRTTQTLGERFLWMALKSAAPSFNNVPLADDNGRNFYALNRDVASGTLPAASLTRVYTMNLKAGSKTTFLAMISDNTVSSAKDGYAEAIFLDPTKFYNITLTASPSTTGLSWTMFRDYVGAMNPNFLVKTTQAIEIYIPSTFRDAGASVATMPKSTSYFIRCDNNHANACATEHFNGLISFRNAQNSAVVINSFDDYLKTMPSASGGIPPLVARVVKLIRYELRKTNIQSYGTDAGDLYYTTWDGTQFASPVLIADRVTSVVFRRPDITDPTITIDLTAQSVESRIEGK